MKFLAVSSNTGDPTPFLAAEMARTEELAHDGVFTQVLLKADWSGAVIIVDAPDQPSAVAAVDSLPLVVNGLTSFQLTEVVDPPIG